MTKHAYLARQWATQTFRTSHREVGNMVRDGRSIYSWGLHWCIATLDPDTRLPPADDLTAEPRPVCWFHPSVDYWTTVGKHSVSTGTHTRTAEYAAERAGYTIVPLLGADVFHLSPFDNAHNFASESERKRALTVAEHWLGKAKRARKQWSINSHTRNCIRALSHYRLSCLHAGMPVDTGAIQDVEQELFLIRARGLFLQAA